MTKGVPPQAGSGHSPKGGAASSTASPAKPSVPNADTADHAQAFYGILNAFGQFWTPLVFGSERKARQHIEDCWYQTGQHHDWVIEHFKIVPVRAIITLAQGPR